MSEQTFSNSDNKLIWASVRSVLELDSVKHKKNGKRSQSHWSAFEKILHFSEFFLKLSGLHKRGIQNSLDVKHKELTFTFPDLPEAFDGFSILHLSDLHIDAHHQLADSITRAIPDEVFDVCVLTGDYRFHTEGAFKQILKPLGAVTSQLKSHYGNFAVLGNHDTGALIEYEKDLNLKFLVNDSFVIEKNKNKLVLTGTDDPFKYFTQRAVNAMEESEEGFKIALVHTTELADTAAENNYKLYLCGHTHAGQICLPGGTPLITHQYEGRGFHSGIWHKNGMTGYTHSGCGVSGIPIRFFSRGETVKIVLKRDTGN